MKNLILLIRRSLICFILSLSVMSHATVAQHSEVWVIANPSASVDSLSRGEIRQIFMGGTLSRKFDAVSLPVGDSTRIKFNTQVIGLTESRIQSYWAQLLFTGRSKPPKEFPQVEEVLNYVAHVENAVGYVPKGTVLPENLVVIYQH